MSSPRRVLVVDDDAGIRGMLTIVLEEAGYDVRTADGLGPVELGDAEVIVLDVRLGPRSAVDLLHDQPELGAVPVVLMTASGATSRPPSQLTPQTTLITKPFDLETLESAVGAALATREPGNGPRGETTA